MPVSGLVVSFAADAQLRESAIQLIRSEPRIEVGTFAHNKLAIVVDTTSSEEDKQLWEWLNTLPGVVFVDVALVGFE